MARTLTIDGREIADHTRCFIIAEIGHNHQGSVEKARELFREAKLAGADAVKLQKRDNRGLYTAAAFNKPDVTIVDHHTYVFLGDGCLMEGISHEACAFAGTQKLGKLIGFYDDNGISIDGYTHGWFTDDTPKRFEAYGWHVVRNVDGHDPEAIRAAIEAARAEADRPSLICCKTVIGYGAPNVQGTAATHGSALGDARTMPRSLGRLKCRLAMTSIGHEHVAFA